MREYTEKIREKAMKLLAEGKVEVFIGYRKGTVPMMNHPVLIREPAQADLLHWDSSCGLTLCQDLHIGQARQLVFSDLVRRTLEYKGYEVTHVVNVTDIDDRTIEGAEKEGVGLKEFTERYYQEFLKDLDSLLVKKATAYPKASEHIEEMIQFSGKLLDKGYAYEKFRSLYFDISRFRDYGKLSRIDLDKMNLGKNVALCHPLERITPCFPGVNWRFKS